MKILPFPKQLLALAMALLAAAGLQAQMPGGGSPAGINAALIKLFGEATAFSAKADIQVLDASQKETMSVPMDFALLDKKVRAAIDMTQIKSKELPLAVTDGMKQMGLAQVVSLIRPDQKVIHIIYPDRKCFLNLDLPKEEIEAAEKTPKMEKTVLGKETIDGHPCVKHKVIVKDDKGPTLEATTWNATDLKDFPVQIQTQEQEKTTVLRFHKVQLTKPDNKDFEVPSGYTQYNDQQDLMLGVMKNTQGPAAKSSK